MKTNPKCTHWVGDSELYSTSMIILDFSANANHDKLPILGEVLPQDGFPLTLGVVCVRSVRS